MKNIKLIALDLDDTTLDNNGQLSYNTKSAIDAAIRAGIEVVIASGRSYFSLPDEAKNIPGIRYAICSNGANIYDNVEKKIIYQVTLTEKSVDDLLRIAADYCDVKVDAFMNGIPHSDKAFMDNLESYTDLSKKTIEYKRKTRITEPNIIQFINENKTKLDCINFTVFDEKDREEIIERLKKEVEDIYITSSVDHLLEISYKDSGKGAALRVLAKIKNIDMENIAAFGNADNDADMIESAGLGVAVKNASKSCLLVCDYVTESNQNDGVALVIGELLLEKYFRNNKKIAIALSGGTDSSYLFNKALEMDCDVKAYFVKTQFQPKFELEDAKKLVGNNLEKLKVINVDILKDKTICENPENRCYFCKKLIMSNIMSEAGKDGYFKLCDGTNFSDEYDSRPGMKALKEYNIESPLRECCLTKKMIRLLSERDKLFTWNKPSYSCLATRIINGERITAEVLEKIEQAENVMSEFGFYDFRVRVLNGGNTAVLEIKKNQLGDYLKIKEKIDNSLSILFKEISLGKFR